MIHPLMTSPARSLGGADTSAPAHRLPSLDAFRGMVILTMIFVNFLAGVQNIPAWARHMPGTADGYTFVDLVFPGFLFIVGVTIPLSLNRRRQEGQPLPRVLQHVATRAAALLFLGVILVNEDRFDPQATGLSRSWWYLLALICVVILWNAPARGRWRTASVPQLALRVVAVLLLGVLLILFRGRTNGEGTAWLRHSWWGILGLIGWAYLTCSLVYLATGGASTALMGALGFMICLYIGDRHGVLSWLGPVRSVVGVGEVLGSTSATVMAGVLVGNRLLGERPDESHVTRIRFMAVFGAGLFLAGSLLRPLHGIVKNQATDAYSLVAAGICCGLLLGFYVLVEVLRQQPAVGFLLPAGQNPLLTYLLPDLLMNLAAATGLEWMLWPCRSGWPGAINAAVLTAMVLLLTWGLTRAGVRLRL